MILEFTGPKHVCVYVQGARYEAGLSKLSQKSMSELLQFPVVVFLMEVPESEKDREGERTSRTISVSQIHTHSRAKT